MLSSFRRNEFRAKAQAPYRGLAGDAGNAALVGCGLFQHEQTSHICIYMWSQNSSHDSKIRILDVGDAGAENRR